MAQDGSKAVVSFSPDDTTYNNISDLNSVTDSESGNSIEVTAFGADWKSFIQGLNEFSFDLSGFWDPTDTNGQVAMRNAFLNKTAGYVQFLYDGTSGVKGQVIITKFERKAAPGGAIDVSITCQGTGTPTEI